MLGCDPAYLFTRDKRRTANFAGKPLQGHFELDRCRPPEGFRRPAEKLRRRGDAVDRSKVVGNQEGLTGFPKTASPAIWFAVCSSRRMRPASM